MTDKQIIIDGVDVSGCKHYKNRNCIADYLLTDMDFSEAKCELCKNCYFKQLKRKERECEELKKQLQAQCAFTRHEQKLIYCVAYDETCKTGNDCRQEKCIFKDNIKLKQTLAEIEDIAMGIMDDDLEESSAYYDAKQILQKISEVEDERN